MDGLFYNKEVSENTTLNLLRFYENGYVLFKKVVGNNKEYLTKELKSFSMNGHIVNGQPEFTFCGAFELFGDTIQFRVENEIRNPSDSWVEKDILTFKGKLISENELDLKQISKRTKFEIETKYTKTTDVDLLNEL